jgi:hypothetical protein
MRPVGAELFLAGGQTYRQTKMMNLIVALCNSANAPKNELRIKDFLFLRIGSYELFEKMKQLQGIQFLSITFVWSTVVTRHKPLASTFKNSVSRAEFLCSVRSLIVRQLENILLNAINSWVCVKVGWVA